MAKKIIGIIGGMGPLSSVKLYADIISYCQGELNLHKNDQYPHILISNLPVPDLINTTKDGEIAKSMIIKELKKFESIGVTIFAIACNTVHIYIKDFRKNISNQLLSIIEETVIELKQREIKKVFLLATPVTIKSKMYQDEFQKNDIETLEPTPTELKFLGKLIPKLVGKIQTDKEIKRFNNIISNYAKRDVGAVVLACTELSFGIERNLYKIPVIDTMETLGKRITDKALED